MRSKINRFLTGIIFWGVFSVFSFKAAAQGTSGIIKGSVQDEAGKPLAGAIIKAQPSGKTTLSNESGNYILHLKSGHYEISFSFIGYKKTSKKITVLSGQQQELSAKLSTQVQDKELEEVLVVGSRNPKRSATDGAVPIDIIPLKQITGHLGQLDVTQMLTFLAPSFNSVRQSLGDGTDHVDPAQLRGLGSDQVLVLVNGKRYHQTSLVNVNGTVNKGTSGTDLNSIPASSIDHIEILRDGAAAQYGSDAIAGVINIVLKKNSGLSVNASYGENITSYDKYYSWNKLNKSAQRPNHVNAQDGKNSQLAINYSIPLKKGFLNITGEYLYRGSTNRSGLYGGQLWPKVNGVDKSDSINTAKGLTRDNFDIQVGNSEMKSIGGVVNFGYPIGKDHEFYANAIINHKNGYAKGLYRYPYTIAAGQSNFPTSNSSSATAAALVLELYPIGFLPQENTRIEDYSLSTGLKGNILGWKYDLSETFGYNSFVFLVNHSVNYTQAFLSGMTASELQTSFNSGKTSLYQSVSSLDFSKSHPILQGLNTALGIEYRIDGYGIKAGEKNSYANLTSDNNLAAAAGAQVFSGFLPSNAGNWSRSNIAIYSDNELDVTKKWLISGALRLEHYSDFGTTLNYKISTRYKLTDWLSFRGAASSGFRAPSLQQEHYSKVTTLFTTINGELTPVQSGTFTNDSKIASILGIPKLKQETSQSYSLGLSATPIKGLDITIDAFQTNINNRIILSNSFSGGTNAELTSELYEAGASTASVFANAIDTRSKGIEGVISYTLKIDQNQSLNFSLAHSSLRNRVRRGSDGKIIIHASETLENSGQISSYFTRADQSRIEAYSPQTKDIFMVQYKNRRFSSMLRISYFGKVSSWADSTSGANISANSFDGGTKESLDQTFKGKILSDLSFSYKISKGINFTVGANNLLDVYPDKIKHYGNTSTGRFTYSRAVSQFGTNGRYVFSKLSLDL